MSTFFRGIEINETRFKIYNIASKKWEVGGMVERTLSILNSSSFVTGNYWVGLNIFKYSKK